MMMAPIKKRVTPTAAAAPSSGTPMPISSPSAPAALGVHPMMDVHAVLQFVEPLAGSRESGRSADIPRKEPPVSNDALGAS
jgi:hypothetical protein